MSNPCEQKDNIDNLYKLSEDNKDKLHGMEVRQVQIAGDVAHVKTRIDNGMSHTLQRIDANLIELKPIIAHHASIVKRIEDFGWLISRWVTTGLVMTLLGVLVWAISKGFKPGS